MPTSSSPSSGSHLLGGSTKSSLPVALTRQWSLSSTGHSFWCISSPHPPTQQTLGWQHLWCTRWSPPCWTPLSTAWGTDTWRELCADSSAGENILPSKKPCPRLEAQALWCVLFLESSFKKFDKFRLKEGWCSASQARWRMPDLVELEYHQLTKDRAKACKRSNQQSLQGDLITGYGWPSRPQSGNHQKMTSDRI